MFGIQYLIDILKIQNSSILSDMNFVDKDCYIEILEEQFVCRNTILFRQLETAKRL